MKSKKLLYIILPILVLLLSVPAVNNALKTYKTRSVIREMSSAEFPSAWYLLFDYFGIIAPPEVEKIEIGRSDPNPIDSNNEEYEVSVIKEEAVITDVLACLEEISVAKRNSINYEEWDECIELCVFSNHDKERDRLQIRYRSDTEEYMLKTYGYNEGWWKVASGTEYCEELFRLCQLCNES